MRIIFMGTPELASHVLSVIHTRGYNVVAAVTAPDRPAGRGRKIRQSPVKEYGMANGIHILQPPNLKDPTCIDTLKEFAPDLIVVVAFRMLPKEVWMLPTIATFNLHASLLPDYRGAAPINWAIINGEKETGVTTFVIDEKIDTGQILFRRKIPVDPYETAGSLHEKVKHTGADLVIETIDALAAGTVSPVFQEHFITGKSTLKKAPKICKEDCRIRWDRPCSDVVNLIHGLSPYPGAFCDVVRTTGEKIRMKIYQARPLPSVHGRPAGEMHTDNISYIHFTTPDGYVRANVVQIAGKKPMHVEELLRGIRFDSPSAT